MKKNNIMDFVFGVIAVVAVIMSLTGCTDTDNNTVNSYTAAPVQEVVVNEVADTAVVDEKIETIIEEEIETTADIENDEPEINSFDPASVDAIKAVCGLKAECEVSYAAGAYDCNGEHPYGPVYDFGADWNNYVAMCDWSLVFDADYYAATFPFLALEYHNDADELLFHFQTVGVHEGRQGNADFNIGAYALNTGMDEIFGENWEAYYLYYMLNYDAEKDVNTVTRNDNGNVFIQYDFRPTYAQYSELNAVNADRADVNVGDVSMYGELNAFAEYRAYINAHDGYKAHDWARSNVDHIMNLMSKYFNANSFGENTVTWHCHTTGQLPQLDYHNSESHYECMVNSKYVAVGVSNFCMNSGVSSQFDFYVDNTK